MRCDPTNGRLAPLAVVLVLMAQGCAEDILRSLTTVTDEFLQNAAAEIDVLWVVDNSESMAEEQTGLGSSFQEFIDNLLESQVDYHIGVISTDSAADGMLHFGSTAGQCVGQLCQTSGLPCSIDADCRVPFIYPEVPRPQGVFLDNVKVGITGSRREKAFETAAMALGMGFGWDHVSTPVPPNRSEMRPGHCRATACDRTGTPCVADGDCSLPFLRAHAALFIIMVSDEDDKSFGPVYYYRRLFESYKGPGNEALVSVSAIVGPPGDDGGCYSAERGDARPGDRYVELAGQSGGIWASICDNFAESLRDLSITAAGLKSVFELSSRPNLDPDRMPIIPNCQGASGKGFCVRVNGRVQGDDTWDYDESRGTAGAIVFKVDHIPGAQGQITVEYQEAP